MNYKIRIKHFASFNDSGEFELTEGVNVLGGINNAGKTAMLWALAMLGMPVDSQRRWYQVLYARLGGYLRPGVSPTIVAEFALPRRQRDAIMGRICGLSGNPTFPAYSDDSETFQFSWSINSTRAIGFHDSVIVRSGKEKSVERNVFQFQQSLKKYTTVHPFGMGRPDDWQPKYFPVRAIGTDLEGRNLFQFEEKDDVLAPCWPRVLSTSILIEAQRKVDPGRGGLRTIELEPDAANLAQVLETAQLTTSELPDGQERFRRIVEEMRVIFPEILRIRTQVHTQSGQQPPLEILLDLTHQRTVPLAYSGTGVQQMLALLTGAVLQPRPTLFLIDEPHSNLHPAAERSLLRILESFGREFDHLFCITTQSSVIANRARRKFIAVSFGEGDGSKVKPLGSIADICSLLGIENMDLFTYDSVLFAEGPSDVSVFAKVLEFFDRNGNFDRSKIVDLLGDGMLRSPKMALKLVGLIVNASTSQVRVPVGLLLDSNDWTDEERRELEKVLNVPKKSCVGFLHKPELEDYLIHEGAIARVLASDASVLGLSANRIKEQVAGALLASKDLKKGSERLARCFITIIPGHQFAKKRDCVRIADAILAVEPEFLRPLYNEVAEFVQSIGSRGGLPTAPIQTPNPSVGNRASIK